MTVTIPQMDQKMLNKYFPGQVVKKVMRTPLKSVRCYSVEGNKALIISTAKFKSSLAAYASQIALQTRWNTSINKEGDHIVCLLYP